MSDIFTLEKTSLSFGQKTVLDETDLHIREGRVTCVIGPSGAGKTTLLRSLNRLNDSMPGFRQSGRILFRGEDIYNGGMRAEDLRQRVGMVFQKPCMFPGSIEENVVFGIRQIREKRREGLGRIAERTLRAVGLWAEVRGRLNHEAGSLSEGQKQRLAIARALAVGPEALLLDEPTSSLDHRSTAGIEDLIRGLGKKMSVVLVTHRLEQARALTDDAVFICGGRVCESGEAGAIFENPENIETRCYVGGGSS